jgi:hypothetical protein
VPSPSKIADEATKAAFEVADQCYRGETMPADAIKTLNQVYSFNQGSARDYIQNYAKMRAGQRYTRTLNGFATRYFLEQICARYGPKSLSDALHAVHLHIAYYESLNHGRLNNIREIVAEFDNQRLIVVPTPEDELPRVDQALGADPEAHRITAKNLAQDNGLVVKHALYRRTGDWYHILNAFPGALLDLNGYLYFASQVEYEAFVEQGKARGVIHNRDTNTLVVHEGISNHVGYLRFAEAELFHDEEMEIGPVTEGARLRIIVNAYERSASARRRSIQKWGLDCAVCDFNFEKVYGNIGAGFIHVHHLVPISAVGAEYQLDPENDLRPVCPNCHAMLHLQNPPLSIEELRSLLAAG